MDGSIMPAGRPAEVDGDGNPIAKCLVNCTIPTKLRDFLKQHGVNRSELFRNAALKMYEGQLCPKCYSEEIQETYKGKKCLDCNKWLTIKPCVDCDTPYSMDRHGTMYEDRIVCYDCFNKYQHDSAHFFVHPLSSSKDD